MAISKKKKKQMIDTLVEKGRSKEEIADLLVDTQEILPLGEFEELWLELFPPERPELGWDFPQIDEKGLPLAGSYDNFVFLMTSFDIKFSSILGHLVITREGVSLPFDEQARLNLYAELSDFQGYNCREEDQYKFAKVMASQHKDEWIEEVKSIVWNGEDLIQEMYNRLDSQSKDDFEFIGFKKALHGMVASHLDLKSPDGSDPRNELTLILVGGEGSGKTQYCRKLAIPLPVPVVHEGHIDAKGKDHLIRTSENLIWIVSEIDASIGKYDIGHIKDFLTIGGFKARRSYGRIDESLSRRCTFIGSTNKKRFLTPGEEHRRFIIINTGKIDYTSPLDVHQLYAQVIKEREEGFENWLSPEEIKANALRSKAWEKLDSMGSWMATLEQVDVRAESSTKRDLWMDYNKYCRYRQLPNSSENAMVERLTGMFPVYYQSNKIKIMAKPTNWMDIVEEGDNNDAEYEL